jgi:hypothetical protein
MQVKEIEKLSRKELRQRADDAFAKAEEKGPSYLMEAQFYMRELEHRHDSWVSIRDLILEIVVIVLILGEILISIHEGNAQARLIAAQTQILQNLQTSTKNTADSLAEQLAIQYKVFISLQANANSLSVFNNSKNEVTFWGMKIGNRPPKANPGGPVPVPGSGMTNILIEQFYAKLFENLSRTEYVAIPVTVYLKSANSQEYVAQCTFDFSGQGFKGIAGVETTLRAEKWSDKVTFSPAPSGSHIPSSRPQNHQ